MRAQNGYNFQWLEKEKGKMDETRKMNDIVARWKKIRAQLIGVTDWKIEQVLRFQLIDLKYEHSRLEKLRASSMSNKNEVLPK